MAARKKTTTEVKPKTFTLTEKQFETLKEISNKITNVRQKLKASKAQKKPRPN